MTRWAWTWCLAAALAACGGHDGGEPPSAVSTVIGPQGGTVAGPDGVQVVVPAGALDQPTTIGIARSSVGAPTPLPEGSAAAGSIYEFTPHGLVFNTPVTIVMPVPSGAVGTEVFMASPGEGWQVNETTVTAGVAQWQRNSFSWGMHVFACAIPINNTDPYPCVHPKGFAAASATPSAAITRVAAGTAAAFQGSAGSWAVNQAATVQLTLNYEAAPDCGGSGGGVVNLIRWNPAVTPRVATPLLVNVPVALTSTPVTVPPGVGSTGGGPTLRGKGSTTVDVSAHLADATNAFYFSFSCQRPGHPVHSGGDLITIVGPMPAPAGPYAIGGSVSGLTGAGLVLQNNGADNLAVTANGAFTFAAAIAAGAPYSVSVSTQPSGQTCSVGNAGGAASANVSNVTLTCVSAGPAPLVASAMAAGYANSLVVATDGSVWSWGYQVDPTTGGYKSASPWATTPVQVQGLAGVKAVAISAESGARYALHTDGTVSAWGLNTAGQLGDRTTTTRASPVKVLQDSTTPMDEVCSIAAGAHVLLMARATGCSPANRVVVSGPWIAGWLSNTTIGGESSSPSPANGAIAKAVPGWPAGQVVDWMSAPDAASAAGAAFFMTGRGERYVWGANGGNLLGAGTSVTFAGGAAGPVQPADGLFWSGIGRVELGRDFSIAIDETGSLVGVGRNVEGQLGGGGTGSTSALAPVSVLSNVSAFSVGQVSAAAITGGQLWAWGWNGNIAVTRPTRVGTATGFSAVAVGDIHSLAIGPGGEVYSWGDSSLGALGRSGGASIPAVVMRP